jgi:hypothetical protein
MPRRRGKRLLGHREGDEGEAALTRSPLAGSWLLRPPDNPTMWEPLQLAST